MVYWLHSCSLTISCMYSYFIMSITLKVDFITACMCRVLDSSCGFFSVMLVFTCLYNDCIILDLFCVKNVGHFLFKLINVVQTLL